MSLGEFEGRRTSKNVISNGVVACFMAAFGGYYLPFVGGFIGAIATATADTLAYFGVLPVWTNGLSKDGGVVGRLVDTAYLPETEIGRAHV